MALSITCEEEKNVSGNVLTHVYLYDSADSGLQVVTFRLGGVEDLHGVSAARHVHQRSVVKVLLKLYRVMLFIML